MIIGLIESCADMFNESMDSKDEEKVKAMKMAKARAVDKKQSKVKI